MGEDGNNQYLMNKENYLPINIISVIYQQIRGIYTPIIKNLIAINEEDNLKINNDSHDNRPS